MMFGHANDDSQQTQDTTLTTAPEPVADGMLAHDDAVTSDTPAIPPAPSSSLPSEDYLPVPSEPPAPTSDSVTPSILSAAPTSTGSDTDTDDGDSGQLLGLKQQALQQLSPLLNHLDQTPEEKFRTTMMMIQATDNQDLIKAAYEAAQQISDEKVKAQALLDIVNEINYFTQHPSS